MSLIQKHITFFGQRCTLACDAKCHKAWGINNRPKVYLEDQTQTVRGFGYPADHYPQDMPEDFDEDNYASLSDDELPDAPASSNGTPDDGAYKGLGTWEGGDGKPETEGERLNKWCARECERSIMPDGWIDVDPSELPDFSVRQYNIDQDKEP